MQKIFLTSINPVNASKTSPDKKEESEIAVAEKNKLERPKRFKVIIHNDDYTTMEFVVMILQKIFHKSFPEAQEIMLKVHQEGRGICGVYTFEVAESKSSRVKRMARD